MSEKLLIYNIIDNYIKYKSCDSCIHGHIIYCTKNNILIEIGECININYKKIISGYDMNVNDFTYEQIDYDKIYTIFHNYNFFTIYKIIDHKKIMYNTVLENKILLMMAFLKLRNFEKYFIIMEIRNNNFNIDIMNIIIYKLIDYLYDNHINNKNIRSNTICTYTRHMNSLCY